MDETTTADGLPAMSGATTEHTNNNKRKRSQEDEDNDQILEALFDKDVAADDNDPSQTTTTTNINGEPLEKKRPGPNKTTPSLDMAFAKTTTTATTSTLQLSTNEYCSHDGCSYHAITRKPLCIFHIGTEETKFDTLKRSLNKLPPNPSVQQLEDKATQLEKELQDVKHQIEIAKEREEREAQEEIARQLIIGNNNVQEGEGEETNVITTLDTIVGTTKKILKMTPGYRQCRIEGCTNYAIRGGICVRHGAPGKKPCAIEGKFCLYTLFIQSVVFCIQFIFKCCCCFCTHIIIVLMIS